MVGVEERRDIEPVGKYHVFVARAVYITAAGWHILLPGRLNSPGVILSRRPTIVSACSLLCRCRFSSADHRSICFHHQQAIVAVGAAVGTSIGGAVYAYFSPS